MIGLDGAARSEGEPKFASIKRDFNTTKEMGRDVKFKHRNGKGEVDDRTGVGA